MNRLEDMSDDALLSLDEEQTLELLDLECAHRGVPLLPEVPVPPSSDGPKPDLTVYTLPDLYFSSKEQADQVLEFARSMSILKREYQWFRGGSHITYDLLPEEEDLEIKAEKGWSPQAWSRHASEAQVCAEAKNLYEEAKRKFTSIERKRKEVLDDIQSAVSEARKRNSDRQDRISSLARYRAIAGNDEALALRFYFDAHHPNLSADVSEHDEIIESLLPLLDSAGYSEETLEPAKVRQTIAEILAIKETVASEEF